MREVALLNSPGSACSLLRVRLHRLEALRNIFVVAAYIGLYSRCGCLLVIYLYITLRSHLKDVEKQQLPQRVSEGLPTK